MDSAVRNIGVQMSFLHFVNLNHILVIISFEVQKLLNLMQLHLSFLPLAWLVVFLEDDFNVIVLGGNISLYVLYGFRFSIEGFDSF